MTQNGRRSGDELNARREIRRGYRELKSQADRESSNLVRPDSDGLTVLLEKTDELFGEVTKLEGVAATSEAVLDAQVLLKVSSLGYQKARKLHVDDKFDPNTFMEKLVTFMHWRTLREQNARDNEIDEQGWEKLASEANSAFKRAPGFHFMYGTFEREPKRKKPPGPRPDAAAAEASGPKSKPEKVKSMGKSQQEVTTEEVEKMVSILRQITTDEEGNIEPISYFEFVINPYSFSQTVENIFHLSFILKDGHAKIYLDEDGLPVIEPAKPHSEEKGARIPKKQVLVSIDIEEWEELKRVFDIKEPWIPHREERQ